MNIDKVFDLLVDDVFIMIPQLGRLGPKAQDLVICFCLGKGETLPQFYLKDLQARREMFLMRDKTGQTNNFTGR